MIEAMLLKEVSSSLDTFSKKLSISKEQLSLFLQLDPENMSVIYLIRKIDGDQAVVVATPTFLELIDAKIDFQKKEQRFGGIIQGMVIAFSQDKEIDLKDCGIMMIIDEVGLRICLFNGSEWVQDVSEEEIMEQLTRLTSEVEQSGAIVKSDEQAPENDLDPFG